MESVIDVVSHEMVPSHMWQATFGSAARRIAEVAGPDAAALGARRAVQPGDRRRRHGSLRRHRLERAKCHRAWSHRHGDSPRYPHLEECYCYSTDYPHPEGGKNSKALLVAPLGDDVSEKYFVSNGQLLFPD
jgi:hypothetical protein